MNELELILKAKTNDATSIEIIITKYKALVCQIARGYYFVSGGDRDDLIQEGTIGLLKAIRGFDPERNNSFASFAAFCIKNNIKDAIRRSASDKNKVLNEAAALQEELKEDVSKLPDPMSEYIDKEDALGLYNALSKILNKMQMTVLRLYLDGYTYKEMAEKLNKNQKYIDNTLSIVKIKVRKFYMQQESKGEQ